MAYNKIIYGGDTLIDLTSDTVTSAAHIMQGHVGHLANGTQVTGTGTSDATASATDIISGQTAYINGNKITGSLVVQNYYTGSSTPSSSLGNNGDLYLQS